MCRICLIPNYIIIMHALKRLLRDDMRILYGFAGFLNFVYVLKITVGDNPSHSRFPEAGDIIRQASSRRAWIYGGCKSCAWAIRHVGRLTGMVLNDINVRYGAISSV